MFHNTTRASKTTLKILPNNVIFNFPSVGGIEDNENTLPLENGMLARAIVCLRKLILIRRSAFYLLIAHTPDARG